MSLVADSDCTGIESGGGGGGRPSSTTEVEEEQWRMVSLDGYLMEVVAEPCNHVLLLMFGRWESKLWWGAGTETRAIPILSLSLSVSEWTGRGLDNNY